MRILKKNHFVALFTMFYIMNIFTYSVDAKILSDIHIVEDSSLTNTLPQYFRKTTDLKSLSQNKTLDLTGLDKLNISGSEQFTLFNLPLIKNEIPTNFLIYDIDLREESHGFINGIAISFANQNNSANKGLNLNQVITKENSDLQSIKLNSPLTLYNTKATIVPTSVKNELEITNLNNISYIRIPVTDGYIPNTDMVNYFLEFIKNKPNNSWIHFHCKAGVGRTTTFMIMYDIFENCNNVSLDSIITRQVLLSKIPAKNAQNFYSGKKYLFLKQFYDECKNTNPTSKITNKFYVHKSPILHFA